MSDTSKVDDESKNTGSSSLSPVDSLTNLNGVLQDFLKVMNADVQKSKFSIEKIPEGMKIEINFLAIVKTGKSLEQV